MFTAARDGLSGFTCTGVIKTRTKINSASLHPQPRCCRGFIVGYQNSSALDNRTHNISASRSPVTRSFMSRLKWVGSDQIDRPGQKCNMMTTYVFTTAVHTLCAKSTVLRHIDPSFHSIGKHRRMLEAQIETA